MGARKRAVATGVIPLGLILLAGCSGDAASDPTDGGRAASSTDRADRSLRGEHHFQTVSHTETVPQPADPPPVGSPAWLLAEIDRRRSVPFPDSADLDAQREERLRRNREIIRLAERAVALTHQDSRQEVFFNTAIRHLLESRRQLALLGDSDQADALYEHADALFRRDPTSRAAADAAYLLAEFVYENARRLSAEDPRWIAEFATQARTFARSFPHEQARAVSLLLSAGRTCELHHVPDEALVCYTLLQERFPNSSEALQAIAILRRLHLVGHPPQLAGPTLDGGYLNIEELRGRPVMVVFWAADNDRFRVEAPRLLSLAERGQPDALSLVGVCLDDEEASARSFVQEAGLNWPQIFYPDRRKRRWNHPLVEYYGVRDIPMYWLLNRRGEMVAQAYDLGRLALPLEAVAGQ